MWAKRSKAIAVRPPLRPRPSAAHVCLPTEPMLGPRSRRMRHSHSASQPASQPTPRQVWPKTRLMFEPEIEPFTVPFPAARPSVRPAIISFVLFVPLLLPALLRSTLALGPSYILLLLLCPFPHSAENKLLKRERTKWARAMEWTVSAALHWPGTRSGGSGVPSAGFGCHASGPSDPSPVRSIESQPD